MIRHLLPAVVGIVMTVAFLRWTGARQGLYGDTVGILLMTTVTISILVGLLWYFAVRLDRDDARRRSAEHQPTLARERGKSPRFPGFSRGALAIRSSVPTECQC